MPGLFSKTAIICDLLTEIERSMSVGQIDQEQLKIYQKKLLPFLENALPKRTDRWIHKVLDQINAQLETETVAMDVSDSSDESESSFEYLIQIPSPTDLMNMINMTAGGKEDQQTRLTHMNEVILSSEVPLKTTDEIEFNQDWKTLFEHIDKGNKAKAKIQLQYLARTDPLMKLILTIHPIDYLESIINNCISAHQRGFKRVNSDILITPKTFELLIKDLACTLNSSNPIYLSFGLPSHHAFSDEGSGFCLLNKIAILIKNTELNYRKPLKYVIIGTDVNRDNGLCQVLYDKLSHLNICHIDIFDSGVYPCQDIDAINEEFGKNPTGHALGINEWQHNNLHYFAVNLAHQERAKIHDIHPAILFALNQLKEQIRQADSTQPLMLFLPTGWDSHEKETAPCGKFINGRPMTQTAAKKHRFNNQDLVYFYEQVLQLYKENNSVIAGIYWGLEGGYEQAMYEEQITLMLNTFAKELKEEPQLNSCLIS